MITLKNEKLTVEISESGAEIKSIKCGETEYIWNAQKDIWAGSAPIIFPICGGLMDDKYVFEGKEYSLKKHGYLMNTLFQVESADATRAVFLHKSNDETKKSYPFDYEFRAIFTLSGSSLEVCYQVNNMGKSDMYFSVGSHEAYYTPEGIEDYDVFFPEKETLESLTTAGNYIADSKLLIMKDSNVLPLYEKYFTVDALVFKGMKSRKATLRNRKTGKQISVEFPNADYFLIWHKPSAGYICLEPWEGLPDSIHSDYDITKKEGIRKLPSGKVYKTSHKITVTV